MSQGEIVSLGSINVDFQVRAERWPHPGETLLGSDFLIIGGGKGANVAFLARRLGQTSEFGKKFDPTVDRVVFVVSIIAIMINGAMPIWWGTAAQKAVTRRA